MSILPQNFKEKIALDTGSTGCAIDCNVNNNGGITEVGDFYKKYIYAKKNDNE